MNGQDGFNKMVDGLVMFLEGYKAIERAGLKVDATTQEVFGRALDYAERRLKLDVEMVKAAIEYSVGEDID